MNDLKDYQLAFERWNKEKYKHSGNFSSWYNSGCPGLIEFDLTIARHQLHQRDSEKWQKWQAIND